MRGPRRASPRIRLTPPAHPHPSSQQACWARSPLGDAPCTSHGWLALSSQCNDIGLKSSAGNPRWTALSRPPSAWSRIWQWKIHVPGWSSSNFTSNSPPHNPPIRESVLTSVDCHRVFHLRSCNFGAGRREKNSEQMCVSAPSERRIFGAGRGIFSCDGFGTRSDAYGSRLAV